MKTITKSELFTLVQTHNKQLQAFGVKKLSLFGSFIRGEQIATSDVDVLVEFNTGQKTFDNFMHLAFYLEELFGRHVDLLTPESLSPHIGPKILSEVEYVTP